MLEATYGISCGFDLVFGIEWFTWWVPAIGSKHHCVKYQLVGCTHIVLHLHGCTSCTNEPTTRGGWSSLYSIYPTGFGIQKASEARVDQIWSGLHSHFDTSAIAVPPTQQIQGYGQPFGHVGQRCQDAPSWGESTIHWPFIGHRVGHWPCPEAIPVGCQPGIDPTSRWRAGTYDWPRTFLDNLWSPDVFLPLFLFFSNLASPRLFDFVQQPHHCLSPSNPTWMPTKAGIPRGKLGH